MNAIIADDIAAVDADVYFMTHTTNPLLSQQTINDAIRSFRRAVAEKRHDSMFSVTRFQTRFYRSDASPINHDPNNLIRTQDLEPWFAENSNFYLFTKRGFASTRARIGAKPLMVETDVSESIDIDTQKDWDLAEAIAKGTEAAG
jgi:CMP-N-acetylneuraminic acid synthetase